MSEQPERTQIPDEPQTALPPPPVPERPYKNLGPQEHAGVIIFKIIVVGVASVFIFLGTCIPGTIAFGNDFVAGAMMLAAAFFIGMLYLSITKRSIVALVFSLFIAVAGAIAFLVLLAKFNAQF